MLELMVKGILKFILEMENLFEPVQITTKNHEIAVEMKLQKAVIID
jgi:hypothetical protein